MKGTTGEQSKLGAYPTLVAGPEKND